MKRIFKIWRGDKKAADFKDYALEVQDGMVVLDAVHQIQAEQAPDLAVRWNCKAGKCGSCSAEVNGRPSLMCMTRLNSLPKDRPVRLKPMKAFPLIKDLTTDVSWNYEQNKKITPFTPKSNTVWKMQQSEVDRVQEFRKCIECFLCQDTCHVLRTHKLHDEFMGPRFLVRIASLDRHPLDSVDRTELVKNTAGVGFCNITKCCTEVCPEEIKITDNAIIPLKEQVADRFYDPIKWLWRKIFKA